MRHPQPGKPDSTPNQHPRLDEPELRELEQSFAYLHASGAIESHCLVAEAVTDHGVSPWYDLQTRNEDLSCEVQYLMSRNLLEIHPESRSWVRLCDEGEPLPTTEGLVQ